eukprot:g15156.t1
MLGLEEVLQVESIGCSDFRVSCAQFIENIALDRKWDERVQQKEEGYGIVVAQLKHAEGQILEEREKTAAAKREIQKREQRTP